jgi:hypothetical protein
VLKTRHTQSGRDYADTAALFLELAGARARLGAMALLTAKVERETMQ